MRLVSHKEHKRFLTKSTRLSTKFTRKTKKKKQ
jgi:hypothetical protein